MTQQINLYQERFQPQAGISIGSILPRAGIAFISVLLALYAFTYWRQSETGEELRRLEATHALRFQYLEELQAQYRPKNKSAELEAEIRQVSNDIKEKRRVLGLVTGTSIGNDKGFSSYYESLARHRHKDIWFTDIQIGNGGTDLIFRGNTLRAEAVPVLLQSLAQEKDYQSKPFRTFNIRQADRKPWLEFTLSTQELDSQMEQGIELAQELANRMLDKP